MATIYRLQGRQALPLSRAECWTYFSDPRNLEHITPPELEFEALDDFGQMYAGLVLRHRVRPLFRIPLTWLTEITHVREPDYFVDEQRFGPYAFWHHQHHFHDVPGGTMVEDIVHYAVPMGPLGNLAHWLWVRRQLEGIFAFRKRVLEEMFGTLEIAPE